MKELLTLSNIGSSGINTDITPWELGKDFVTAGRNFRVKDGAFTPNGGQTEAVASPDSTMEVGFLMSVRLAENDYWIQASRTKIFAADGTAGWFDISSTGGYTLAAGAEWYWNGCQMGDMVVMNNSQISPEYVQNLSSTSTLAPLIFRTLPSVGGAPGVIETWDDLGYTCTAMRAHKNFLFALGLSGVDGNPNAYRISTPADTDGYPYTWDPADRSGLAVMAQLGSDGGKILDGLTLRNDFVIYSRDSIDLLTFNANSEFFWDRRELSTSIGIIATNCVVAADGKHFFMSDGDVFMTNGSEITSIMHNRIQRRYNAKAHKVFMHRSFAMVNVALKEVWFCIPEGTSETPNIAFIYNYRDDSWAVKDLPTTMACADYGPSKTPAEIAIEDQWDGDTETEWDVDQKPWGATTITPTNRSLLGVYTGGSLNYIDPLFSTAPISGSANVDFFIERTDFPLEGYAAAATVTRVYPHAKGSAFEFRFGSQQSPDGGVIWQPYQIFRPGIDRKLDFRSSGVLIAWSVRSINNEVFRFSGFDIEFTRGGKR